MISLPVRRFLDDQEIFASPARPQSPSVSVILPVYCHNGPLLERAISSVLSQEFTDFELIIVDDGSRDGSFDTAIRFAKQDCRIVVIRHQLNSGLPAIRVNEGIMASRGTYIAYQFDDDEWLPSCLRDLHTEISGHSEPCLVYGQTILYNSTSNPPLAVRTLGDNPFNYGLLKNMNRIANNSVMHHRVLCDIAGMYDPHILLRRFCDHDLWMRYGDVAEIISINKVVSHAFILQEGSLGKSVPISSMLIGRRYMETHRNSALTPKNFLDYDVTTIPEKKFSFIEKDRLYRTEIFPFLTRTTYLLDMPTQQMMCISRRNPKYLTVLKGDYSTAVDVTFRNFLCRISYFPYTFTFLRASEWTYLVEHATSLCILYREVSVAGTRALDYCHQQDIPTAYWIDDNMFRFGEDGDEFAYLKQGTPGWNCLCQNMAGCDLTVSYSSVISEDCRPHSSTVLELSTNIPVRYLATEAAPASERIHFAVFSGNVRRKIFGQLWGALSRFAAEFADRIDITFWGLDPTEFPPLACPVYHVPFTNSYELYLNRLQKNAFQFQICPLSIDRKTDRSKSPIKFLEGLCAGAVSLFSDVPPYDCLPENVCLRTPNSVEGWYNLLKKVLEIPTEERQAIFQCARSFVMRHYTTEAQVVPFITSLDLAELLHRLQGKKIAYVAHETALGGATLHILRHLLLMRELGIKTRLYLPIKEKTLDTGELLTLPKYASKLGIEVQYIPCRGSVQIIHRIKEDYVDGQTVASIFEKEGVGLICSATYMPALGIAAEQLGVPNVTTLHQYYPNPQFTKREDVNIQAIHSSSNRYALEYYKLLNIPAIRIVCPVGPEFFGCYASNLERAIEDFTQENPMHILVSGTLQPRKGQLEAILAVSKLLEKGIPVRLTLIGYDTLVPEYAMKCREAAHTLPEGTVTFIGFTEHPENYYHNTCHVLLCSSIDESMPQTILQSMAAGVFAVSTNCGGVSEIIKDSYNGILLPENTPDVLAEGITRLVKMGATERLFMLNNAHETISAIATPEFVRSELINLYNIAFEELKKHKTRLSIGEPLPEPSSIFKQSSMEGNSLTANEAATSNLCPSRPIGHQRFYPITLTSDSFSRIRLIFTCTTGIAHGKVTARLLFKGKLLREASLNMENICYNQWTDFTILPLYGYKNQCVTLCLSMEYVGDDMLLVYENRERRTLIYKIKNKLGIPCAEKDVLLFNLL